ELMEEYRIDEVIKEIENLFLDLSRVYIQFTRDKANSEPGKVLHAIQETYFDIIKMFSIICPFLTEKIWQELKENKIVKEESVHLCNWPKFESKLINKKLEEDFSSILRIIEKGLYARDKAQIGLKWPLAKAKITTNNSIDKELQNLISAQLNIKKIEVEIKKDIKEISVELDTKMTPELEAEGYAREISRKVQDSRKKAGLVKIDKINLNIIVDDDFKRIIEKQIDFIAGRTNSKKILVNADEKSYKNKFEDKIKGRYLKILFTKI
ncbi:MAG: class I tRNA ligase family protein, partial [Nanoarchaeota archaeon]|nr:class I tRNA ligase family protein [Nanoarchaeota archaeon]